MKVSIKTIIENIPNNLNNIEKVRYIYIEIGKIFAYERDFIYVSDYRAARDMYNEMITAEMVEQENYQNKIVSTCRQAAQVECDAINNLNNPNIKARTVGYIKDTGKHVAVIANIDGKDYYLDITLDLYKIQKGMKTKGFAQKNTAIDDTPCTMVFEQDLKQIDEKIGYCEYGMYMDDVIEMLRIEMEDEKRLEKYIQQYDMINGESKEDVIYRFKIDFIFKYLKNNLSEKDKMRSVELDKYYKKIFGVLLTPEEKRNNIIELFDILKIDNEKNKKDSFFYEIKMKNRTLYYIYDDEQRGLVQTSVDKLKDMRKTGKIEYPYKYFEPEFEKDESSR